MKNWFDVHNVISSQSREVNMARTANRF